MKLRIKLPMPSVNDYLTEASNDERNDVLDVYYKYVVSGETKGPDVLTVEFDIVNKTAKIIENAKKRKYS